MTGTELVFHRNVRLVFFKIARFKKDSRFNFFKPFLENNIDVVITSMSMSMIVAELLQKIQKLR
jgi:hypothetical protein